MCELDLHEGDMVQIRPRAYAYAGEVGRVISIRPHKKWDELSVTVMFSNRESADYYPMELIMLRAINSEENNDNNTNT